MDTPSADDPRAAADQQLPAARLAASTAARRAATLAGAQSHESASTEADAPAVGDQSAVSLETDADPSSAEAPLGASVAAPVDVDHQPSETGSGTETAATDAGAWGHSIQSNSAPVSSAPVNSATVNDAPVTVDVWGLPAPGSEPVAASESAPWSASGGDAASAPDVAAPASAPFGTPMSYPDPSAPAFGQPSAPAFGQSSTDGPAAGMPPSGWSPQPAAGPIANPMAPAAPGPGAPAAAAPEPTDASAPSAEPAATTAPRPTKVPPPILDLNAPVLDVDQLSKRFGEKVAVDSISFAVQPGHFFGIVGPNGAGKTTTLSMATGLLKPGAGHVRVHGIDVWAHPGPAQHVMGVLPDRLRLFDRLTGAQMLMHSGLLRGMPRDLVKERAEDLINAFGLHEAAGRLVADYSAGMTKKIALASAMIHAPRLLVLDEPFESVDPVSSANLIEILENYVAGGGSVVLSSHSMDLVERTCDHIGIVVSGRMLALGSLDEVRAGQSLEERFIELAGGRRGVQGIEWLNSFQAQP